MKSAFQISDADFIKSIRSTSPKVGRIHGWQDFIFASYKLVGSVLLSIIETSFLYRGDFSMNFW